MTKGIVVEVKKSHLIVLSEGGEFRKVKNQNRSYSVGSDIYLPTEIEHRGYQLPRLDWKKTAVFMVALVLLFFQFAPYTGQGVYAYVGMEINPSIELEIDDSMLVQGINAYNTDGKKLVSLLEDWENEHIEVVTDQIFKICRAKGYIKPNQEVIVTTTLNKDVSKEIQQKIERKINTLMEKKAEENKIDMTSLIMSNEDRKRAERLKVSPGKYAIFMAAKQAGYNITKADIRHKSIQELSKAVGSFSDLFSSSQLEGQQHVAVFIHTKPVNQQKTLIPTEPIYTNPVAIVSPPGQTNNSSQKPSSSQPSPITEKPASGNTTSISISPVQDTPASKGDVATAPSGSAVQAPMPAPAPVNTVPASPAKEPSTAPIVEPVKQTLPLPKPDVLPTAPVKEPVKPAVIPPSKEETKGGGIVIALPKDKEGDKHSSTVIPPKDIPIIPAVPKEEPKPPRPEGKCGHKPDKGKETSSNLPLPKPDNPAVQPVKEPEVKKEPTKAPEPLLPVPNLEPVKSSQPEPDKTKETQSNPTQPDTNVSQPVDQQAEKKENLDTPVDTADLDSKQEAGSPETEEPSTIEPQSSEEDLNQQEQVSQSDNTQTTPTTEPAVVQDTEAPTTPQESKDETSIDPPAASEQSQSAPQCSMPTIETFNMTEDAS